MKKILALIFILLLSYNSMVFAANKIYIAPEASITWTDTGGNELLDLGGLAAAGVAMGSFADLGVGSRSEWYTFEMTIDGFDLAPTVGQAVHLFFSQSSATTNFDGNPTTDPTDTAQGSMTLNQTKNLVPVGSTIVYSTTAADELKISGVVRLPLRYVSPVVHNDTGVALLNTADAHKVVLIPIPSEIQP